MKFQKLQEIITENNNPLEDILENIQNHTDYINLNDLDTTQKLKIGQGTYGHVYSIFLKSKNQQIAVKEINSIPITMSCNDPQVQLTVKEIDIFSEIRQMKSENIVEYQGFSYELTPNKKYIKFLILMELCQGSLNQYLDYIKENKDLTLQTALDFTNQLFRLLALCEKSNISHRDLKPQNIMIKDFKKLQLKLGDFSDSIIKADKFQQQTLNTVHGTPQYFSPQVLYRYNNVHDKISYNSYKSDLYSVGVIIIQFCMLNQFKQWDRSLEYQKNPEEYNGSVELGPYHKEWDKIFLEINTQLLQNGASFQDCAKFIRIISKCLIFKESNRPQFYQIYQEFQSDFPQFDQKENQILDMDAVAQEHMNTDLQEKNQYNNKQNNNQNQSQNQKQFNLNNSISQKNDIILEVYPDEHVKEIIQELEIKSQNSSPPEMVHVIIPYQEQHEPDNKPEPKKNSCRKRCNTCQDYFYDNFLKVLGYTCLGLVVFASDIVYWVFFIMNFTNHDIEHSLPKLLISGIILPMTGYQVIRHFYQVEIIEERYENRNLIQLFIAQLGFLCALVPLFILILRDIGNDKFMGNMTDAFAVGFGVTAFRIVFNIIFLLLSKFDHWFYLPSKIRD